MSLTGGSHLHVFEGYLHTAEGETCFYCGSPLHDPALYWMGATGDMYLHPGCWVDLSARLYRDLHEWQRQSRFYFRETNRT